MRNYQRESHYRSLIKSFTWRCIAFADTVLVVLLITCWFGECSLENAFKIGVVEFFVKMLVYYIHERIWQGIQLGKRGTSKQIMAKSISWRILATAMTFVISGTVLNNFNQIALYISITELFTKFGLYYLHEKMWVRLPLGKVRNWVFKNFS
jgi:uncharacterized membrane protein